MAGGRPLGYARRSTIKSVHGTGGTPNVRQDFATVVDVGAGRGQFALVARRRYPTASLHCFEPLAHSREKLAAVVGRDVRVHAIALGSTNTPAHFHVSQKRDSSSILPITDRQVEAFPGAGEAGQIVVNRARLDEVLTPQALARPSLLKIDVQGYELEVLRGSEHASTSST